MFSPNHGSLRRVLGWMLFMSLMLALASCGGVQQGILGKWEQLSGSTGMFTSPMMGSPGEIIEFFKDGTVSFSDGRSGKYSWPDDKHLKIELNGGAFVYGAALNGDDLTITESSSETGVLKRYKSLAPTTKNIAGAWKYGGLDQSGCVNNLGAALIPDRMQFSEDGTFSIKDGEGVETAMISFGTKPINMNGQFSIKSDRISIQASGTFDRSPVQGKIDCRIALSYSRLEFINDQGKITRYHR